MKDNSSYVYDTDSPVNNAPAGGASETGSVWNTPDLTMRGVVHDLNNIFQTLVEAAHLLSEYPDWMPVAAAILRSIERGKEITSSLQAAEQPAAPFEHVLENAMALVRDFLILRRGAKIEFDCEIDKGLILSHSWAWERVLINLFFNAVHAMPQGGVITVRARRNDLGAEVLVADQGPGIAPEVLTTIFEPHVSTKGTSGLGLHIVQTIVQQEGGEVRAVNRDGRGAEFRITVPAKTQRSQGASA